nr:hypothetical protein [Kibdelosporangium sp. MJ126-NF4]
MESSIRGYLAHADLHNALFHHARGDDSASRASTRHDQTAQHGHEADPTNVQAREPVEQQHAERCL